MIRLLKPEDFEFCKRVGPDILKNMDLYVLHSEKEISAFMGILGENLEMLFVSA